MCRLKTIKIMIIIFIVYILALVPGYFWVSYFDSPIGLLAAIPYLSIYIFHSIGVPGLLQNNGACGWGWCTPTAFGWSFITFFWLLMVWISARLIINLTHESSGTH